MNADTLPLLHDRSMMTNLWACLHPLHGVLLNHLGQPPPLL